MECINTSLPEYQTLSRMSGLHEDILYAEVADFMDKHGRFPNLDEIPGANSSKYLEESLHMVNGSANIEDLLAITGAENITDATIALNDLHKDLEIKIFPLNTAAVVYYQRRPSPYMIRSEEEHPVTNAPNTQLVFSNMFTKLREQYGIAFNQICDKDLEKWQDIPEVQTAKAFVSNGEVYINTDLADIDAPIHEMTHILLGSVRFKHPDLYWDLVKKAKDFDHFEERLAQYPNMTREDAMEEIFVEEVGRYLSGLHSAIEDLPENIQYELHYNIKRLLDSVLMGQDSVKSIPNEDLYNLTLPQLTTYVNSMIMQPFNLVGLDEASQHRMLANTKSDLMSKGYLTEDCE